MAISPSSGAKIYIGPTTAAGSVSAYAALAYVEVKEVESIGDFGDSAEVIKFTSLTDQRVQKLKGARDAGELTLTVAHDPRDAGQAAMVTAEASRFKYAFKVDIPDAPDSNDTDTIFYFHGYVSSKKVNVGGANGVIKRVYTIAIDTQIYERASQAVSGG